jgi:hypothetical protein
MEEVDAADMIYRMEGEITRLTGELEEAKLKSGWRQRYFSWKPNQPGRYPSAADANGRGEVWIWNGSGVGTYQWSLVKDVKLFTHWMPREDAPRPSPPVKFKPFPDASDEAVVGGFPRPARR